MTEQAILQWITAYGYLGIFFLLIFGIIGLPVPDEWLLVFSGYLVFKDVLGFVPTVTVAVIGSICGLTASYMMGRTSANYILDRYGRWLSLSEGKIQRTQQWFHSFGRWTLIIGPFVPGVRNLMGFAAGASKLQMHVFARFAYLGALISSVSFVTFGYLVGKHGAWASSRSGLVTLVPTLVFTAFIALPIVKGLLRKRKARGVMAEGRYPTPATELPPSV